MATKKTDILEDFKQRSGQKRQYEEESVSSAGSSSGQRDILADFKQRSAGAQQRSAKRVSEIQKTAASVPKRVQSTSTKETTQKEQNQKRAALTDFLRKDREDTEKYLKETKIRQDTLKAKKAEIYADGDKASDQKIPEKFASDYAKTKLGIVEHGPFKEGLERITPYSELKKQDDYEVQKRKGAAIKTNPVAALDWSVVPGVQDYITQAIKNPSQVSELLKQNNHIFQNMTQEEKDNYNYIYGKYGLERANRYAESLDEQLNVRQGQSMVDMTQKIAEKNRLAGTAADIGLSFTAGVNRAVEGMGQAVDAVVGNPITKPASAFDAYSGLLAEQSTGLKRAAQDIAGSIGFMMPSALTAGALGTVASETLFGVSAAGNSYADSIREGQNVNASKEYAIATGLSETISNLFLNGVGAYGGGALKKVAGNTKVAKAASEGLAKVMKNPTAKRYLVRAFDYAADMGSEGLQEYTQEYMDKVTRNVLFGENNKINPLDPDAWYAAMLGAATAGVMNAPNIAMGLTYEDYFLRKLGKNSDVNSYQDYVEGIETDQNAYQNQEQYEKAQEVRELAEKLAQKQEAGEKISNLEKGYFEEATYQLADSVAEDARIESKESEMENSALTSENTQENDYRTPQGEELELWADGYETNGKKAFTESYDGETDISSYSKAFANYYNAGRYNMNNESVLGAASVILSPEQAKAAYKAGALDRNAAEVAYDRETRSFTNMQKGAEKVGGLGTTTDLATEPQKKMAEYVGKRTGLKVNLVDSMSADRAVASYHNGEITISIDTKDFNGSVSHELTHFIKDYSPDMYQVYEDRCMRAFADVEGFNTNELIESYMNRYEQAGQKLNREQAVEEIVADATQSFLNDEKFINEVVHDDRTLGQKIMDFIDDVIESIKSLIKTGSTRASAKALEQNVQALESARQAWHIALNEGGERYRTGWEVKDEKTEKYKLAHPELTTDEQLEKNVNLIQDSDPIAHLKGDEFTDWSQKKLSEQVLEFYNSIGNKVHNDVVGDVYLRKSSVNDDIAHGIGKNKAITFKAVPEVIENGKVIDVTKNWKERGYDSVAIGGKISIDGGDRAGEYYMVCLLHVDDTNRMYLHEVRTIKTDEMRSKTGTSVGTNLQLPSANHPSILSLLNKIIDVNGNQTSNKKKFQLQDAENNYNNMKEINESGNKHLLESYEERRLHFKLHESSAAELRKSKLNPIKADYTGVSTEIAKTFNSTIEQLSKEYYSGITRIETKKDIDEDISEYAFASVRHSEQAGENALILNQKKLENYDQMVERVKALSKKGTAVRIPDNKAAEYIPTHEFAHGLLGMKHTTDNFIGMDEKWLKGVRNDIEDIFREYKAAITPLEEKVKILKKDRAFTDFSISAEEQIKAFKRLDEAQKELQAMRISEMSTKNADEFLAESFTQAKIGLDKNIYSERVMNVLNENFRKADAGVKFQLKDPVEESENLIAVHNLDADKLSQMLKYDGIPMPSIAITKSEYGWNDFGDISLVFRKDTIDPANKKNKVYGADAWTPTFPQIEYNVNEGVYYDAGRTISDSMNGKIPDYLISEAKRFNDTMSGNPEKNGLDGVINAAQNNIGMKAAYLASKGEQIKDRVQEVDTPDVTPGEETLYQDFLQGIPETDRREIQDLLAGGDEKTVRDIYGSMIVDAFIDAKIKDGLDQEAAEKNRGRYKKNPIGMMKVLRNLKKAFNYQENGVHYTKEIIRDEAGINEEINSKVDEAGYKEWLTNLYDGLVGEQGVPNGKEHLTPSGNRRTFKQLHYEVTPENIVKSMLSQGEDGKNIMGFVGVKTLRAAATENMRSIGEIHKNEDRLQNFSVEDYAAREDALNTRLYNVIDSIIKKTNSNGITDVDHVGEIIQEAAGKKDFSEKKVKETFAEYPYWVASTEDVKEITDIINEVKKMPVNMFEAKPERVVGYDEVAAAVVPSNIDDNVLQGLEDRGIKTVMYDPDTEGARKDAVNALEGIRFQLEDIDEGPSMSELVKENKKLKEANALLKKQFELTSKEEMRQSDIQKQVNKILKQYNSSWNQKMAVNNITKLYEYIRTDQVDMDQLTDVAADIGRTILNKSTVKDTTMYEQYKDTVNKIRNTKISLSDQDKADLATYGGYNAFRKQYFGRLKLGNNGISIDSLYEELSAEHPDVFKSDVTHPADRLMNVASFLDTVRPTVENPYAANIDEMSYIVGQEILDGYNQIRNEAPTFADRKNMELIKAKDQYQQKMDAYKKMIKEEHRKDLTDQMMKFNDLMKEKSDRDLRYKARKSIMKDARELQRWLLDPTDQKNVPKSMRGAIADMLSSIDVSKSYPAAEREAAWSRAQMMFSKIVNEGNVLVGDDGSRQYMEIDPNMIARFDSFVNRERKTNEIGKSGFEEIGARLAEMKDIDDLSIHDLEEMKKLVSSVKKAIAGIGKQRRNERYESTSALASDVLTEMKDRKKALKLSGPLDVGAKLFNYDMLDPQTMFGKIGPAFKTSYDGLRSGLDKKTICLQTAQDYFSDTLSSAGVSTKEIQKWMNGKATTFKTSGGEIKLSTAQIMSLYELDKRGIARQHIYDRKGGIKASDRKRGLIYETQDRAVRVVEADVKKICDTLTPQQKEMADALQRFMGNQVAAWGNEVSMELYGYEKFTAADYFPIMSDGTRIHRHEQDKMGDSTIKNLGFTKKTNQYANNAIVINDIFDVFTKQVDQMSSYAGFVIPLSDLHQLIEYQQPDGGMAVKEEITRAFGDNAINYVDKLVKDINGSIKEDRTIQDFLMSNMKAASVAGNLRVAIQQPTSIARAVAEIDPKYLAMGAVTMEKGRWDKLTQYAPIAMWKDWGFYQMQVSRPMKDVLTGNSSKVQNFVNKTMVFAELGDKLTWNRIWSACEYEVADKHPELKKGSEEFYRAAGKRFSEIIDKTQVVDSVLHRTQIMRSKNGLVKMATAFMGEPLKSYDMLYRAFYDVKAGRKGAKKQLLRSTSAYVASAILTSVAAAVMDATRDDDRDKTWTEKYRASVWDNFKDNINMLGNVPYVKDLLSIAGGNEVVRTDMSGFQDLYYAYQRIEQLKKGESQYTPQYVTLYTLQTMSKATGIPIKSLTRDTFSIIDSVMQGIGGETDYRWIRQKYDISQKKNLGMYSEMMLRAQSNGEKKLAAEIYNDLLENGFDNDTVNNKVENVLKDAVKEDPMLQRLVEAKENLDTKAADEAYKELMDAGYNSDIVIAAVKAVTNSEKTELKKEEDFKKLREAREDSNEKAAEEAYENLVEAGYNPNLIDKVLEDATETYEKIEDLDEIFTEDKTLYQNSDVIQAIDAERWTDVDTMLKQIYESKKASSKKKKESEKAKDARARIKASLSAKYRKRYIAADSAEKQKIRGKLLRIRVDGKRLYDSDSFKTWKEEK